MAIDYGKFVFASPPRTGGTWFIKAASEAGLGRAFKKDLHIPASKEEKKLKVSLVRHPCDWLASYYFALRGGQTGVEPVDVLIPLAKDCMEFEDFVLCVLDEFPGQVSEIMLYYNSDSYIRTQDLQWAAYDLFTSEEVKASPLKAAPAVANGPQNCFKYDIQWSPIIWRRVVDSEPICEHFEFD